MDQQHRGAAVCDAYNWRWLLAKTLIQLGEHSRVRLIAFSTATVVAVVNPGIIGAIITGIFNARIVGTAITVIRVFGSRVGSALRAVVIARSGFLIVGFLGSDFVLLSLRHIEGFTLAVRFLRADPLFGNRLWSVLRGFRINPAIGGCGFHRTGQ